MIFNSIEFLIFFPIFFFAYWHLFNKNLRNRNLLILISSYVFYGWWDWRFLFLILFSSLIDYYLSLQIFNSSDKKKRKFYLIISISLNLGLLGFFKYFNFFIESFSHLFSNLGFQNNLSSLEIILPVGISFYTFQTMSYTFDVYKKDLEPSKNLISYLAFVSFFPQLVAGPIERAKNLLPQFNFLYKFDYQKTVVGLRLILLGLFKKILIADNCADVVNYIFENQHSLDSVTLILGIILFAFQIYGDFSGYSDIAIGIGKIFGFELMRNFKSPYLSRDIAEFWRRWHISLSTWFRDYLFIPIGGSKGSKIFVIRNILIVFTVSGFWHGANWTFIFWGLLNGLYYIPSLVRNKNYKNKNIDEIVRIKDLLSVFITFAITCLAWIFFRAENINSAFRYISDIFILKDLEKIYVNLYKLDLDSLMTGIIGIIILMIFEFKNQKDEFLLDFDKKLRYKRFLVYLIVTILILTLGDFGNKEFIYFQF